MVLKYNFILYISLGIVWIIIAEINTSIYRDYQNHAVKLINTFAPDYEGKLLIYFTFYWSIDDNDSNAIIKKKKTLNKLSILFAALLVLSALFLIFK